MTNHQSESRKFPFQVELSFKGLIKCWEDLHDKDEDPLIKGYIEQVIATLKSNQHLNSPIKDLSILEEIKGEIRLLTSVAFPSYANKTDMRGILLPFSTNVIFSKTYNGGVTESKDIKESMERVRETVPYDTNILYAYLLIMEKFYGLCCNFHPKLIFSKTNAETGKEKIYKLTFDTKFLDIRLNGDLPKLSEDDLNCLKQNMTDIKTFMKKLPSELFTFSGLFIFSIADVTSQELVSQIKDKLLERDTITRQDKFLSLERLVRSYIEIPDAILSVSVMRENEILILNKGQKAGQSCIYNNSEHYSVDQFRNTIFEKAVLERKSIIIGDLRQKKEKTQFDMHMLEHNYICLQVIPLFDGEKVIGTLGIKTSKPNSINDLITFKMKEIVPLFSLAVKRSMDNFEAKVSKVIQEKYTSLHPSVDWRFKKAANKYLNEVRMHKRAEVEEVEFDELYSLYALTDIRGSSDCRNKAIMDDLLVQLNMARGILSLLEDKPGLPIVKELIYEIDKHCENIKGGISSGDEIRIHNFLIHEIEATFADLISYSDDVKQRIDLYNKEQDKDSGVFHQKRKDFDESVSLVNSTIIEYLDRVEQMAQDIFPHYFEKQATDGVDQSIYIGQSITNQGHFDTFHLKNIRLWQLIVMSNIVQIMDELKSQLPLALETTHLVIIQNIPINIRFDLEEKRFIVKGAYNIRYEIIKKRIDKATIKGNKGRLTAPGKIAIVYSQTNEIQDYLHFIDYLKSKSLIMGDIEYLELDDMQGIKGLKALRISVNVKSRISKDDDPQLALYTNYTDKKAA